MVFEQCSTYRRGRCETKGEILSDMQSGVFKKAISLHGFL